MNKKALRISAIIVCCMVAFGAISVLLYVSAVKNSDSYVAFDKNRLGRACSTVKILDKEGKEIEETVSLGSNKQIPLSALKDYTYMAFVAVEDKRFFSHGGLDTKRILGAAVHNLKSGGFKEGASTISQQLIKNTHLDSSKNIKRKINEMLLAKELENNYTKNEILEMYLNTIYFGRSAYGIETAANVYFDKSAADLTVSESAVLAGMIKAPNIYAPDKNVDKCKARRDTVLKLMLEQGIISQSQCKTALESEIHYRPYQNKHETYYTQRVVEEACRLLNMSQAQLYMSDFVIETYYDSNVQRQLYSYASADETTNYDGTAADLSCLICQNDGGVSACYFRGDSALAPKQIGSTAKPIAVYTPALCERLISQASPVLDEPTDFSGYRPTNAGGYSGWTTVKNAVTKSLNVPAVKTLNTLGLTTAQRYLEKLGFFGNQNLSLALGNIEGGMTVHQLAKCYATLANDGRSNDIAYIRRISSEKGEIYTRSAQNVQIYDKNCTFLMTDMLKNAVKEGTAHKISTANIPVAAKTGTVGNANGNSEALVAGYTTQHTFVFWYSGKLPNSTNGTTAPCLLAAKVLKNMYAVPPRDFEMPDGVVLMSVDSQKLHNEQLVVLGDGEKFAFDKANMPVFEPTNTDNYHYKVNCTYSGGVAKLNLPEATGEWKIFCAKESGNIEVSPDVSEDGIYFAELWQNGARVYTTPKIRITLPQINKNGKM